eukprot:5270609-Pleurochrysis_carterae.AAC.1
MRFRSMRAVTLPYEQLGFDGRLHACRARKSAHPAALEVKLLKIDHVVDRVRERSTYLRNESRKHVQAAYVDRAAADSHSR